MSNEEIALRKIVLEALRQVTQANSPYLFSMMHTKDGVRQVEDIVIRKVLHDRMIPAAVIPQLEMEYSMM